MKDGFRLRAGFLGGGGIIKSPTGNGPAFAVSGQIGFQINHYVSVYYQNTPMVTLTPQTTADSVGFKAGFIDFNSVLGGVTLLHLLDLGFGPSYDFDTYKKCAAELDGFIPTGDCQNTSGWHFGLHGRVALIIGGLDGDGPKRSGLIIAADVHPTFLPGETNLTFTLGLGKQWY